MLAALRYSPAARLRFAPALTAYSAISLRNQRLKGFTMCELTNHNPQVAVFHDHRTIAVYYRPSYTATPAAQTPAMLALNTYILLQKAQHLANQYGLRPANATGWHGMLEFIQQTRCKGVVWLKRAP